MDILIKNIEMPKSCGECPFSYKREHYADCRILNDDEGTIKTVKRVDCPLVEVVRVYQSANPDAELYMVEKREAQKETQ